MIRLTVFDTETTGLPLHPDAKDEAQPRIIEFAAATVDEKGDIVSEYTTLINPGIPLEPIITKITGLTDESLKGARPFCDVIPEIEMALMGADAVVAHNLPFDTMLLQLDLRRCGRTLDSIGWPPIGLCTVQEHAQHWGRRPKLKELYAAVLGKPLAQTHRALDDVHALVEVLRALEIPKQMDSVLPRRRGTKQ